MLYPTELWAVSRKIKFKRKVGSLARTHFKLGRSTRIRTLDPLVPNQVRYRAAPHSEDKNHTGWRLFRQ